MNSRLPIDPTTHLPSIQTFGELNSFLRGALADEDSRQLGESMALMARHVEAIVASLRLTRARATLAPLMMDLLTVLRGHSALVVGLDTTWRALYEYAAYLAALNNFRVLIGQWLLDAAADKDMLGVTAEDFELVAWRTMGEGMLLIDMYEQLVTKVLQEGEPSSESSTPAEPDKPRVERALAWWEKLRL